MLNKCRYVVLLLFYFITLVNCEYKHSAIFNLKVDSDKNITCAVKPDNDVVLVQGEKMEITANVLSQVHYMWCKDQTRSTQVDRCTYDVEAKQCSAVVNNLKASIGIWDCEYLLQRNDTSIRSTSSRYKTVYNYARCTLHVDIKGSLWFTGLDPKRRSIKTNAYQTYYEYRFKRGEILNISCEQEGNDTKNFKFPDGPANEIFIGSRFERQASLNLSSKILTCNILGKPRSSQTDIVLHLKQDSLSDPLWFTGLDYSRLTTATIDGTTNYNYVYKLNEDLKIGCDADENDIANYQLDRIFQFIAANSTRIYAIKPPAIFEFSSANSTLNSSSLLCVLRNNTGSVYTVNLYFVMEVSDTAGAQEHKTEPATGKQNEGPQFNWEVVLIAATLVICVIGICVILILRRKKILVFKKLTPKYFTLKKNRAPVPPENAYSGIKEHNDVGDTLYSYADLNRRWLEFGPEETYAEPGYSKTEVYAPTPAQRGSKTPDLNYTNVFKQGYVNSKK